MKKTPQIDRYIVIGSVGILLISSAWAFSKVLYQELKKEQIKTAQQKTLITETLNIKRWRGYHEEQMRLMHTILKELNCQNSQTAQ